MDFSLFAQAPYAILAVVSALLTGVGLGWLIWGGDDAADEALERVRARAVAADSDDKRATASTVDRSVLDRLEQEIKDAHTTLAGVLQEQSDFTDEIDALDGAIKRANGRLRLMAGAQGS
ncbi:MAG: hypothetical protein AAF224_07970 [Pseudomonadota bacterium]